MERGYDAIKRLAKEHGITIPDLLALARKNDPFFAGAPTQCAKAEWFAELWQRFGYTRGVHLRRVHYQVVSQRDPLKHDGKPYENTEACWDYLSDASKGARYLRLVDPEAFEDHRNPDPQVYALGTRDNGAPYVAVPSPEWSLPSIDVDLGWSISLNLPRPSVLGYDYSGADQPYHIELWVEKSTMDDVLVPLCRQLRLNLVTSLGFQSITSVVNLLKRIIAIGKPARIFYISDFDPAGDGMPTAVARQIEYWIADYASDSDIKLDPLALTLDQVQRYQLPRIPVKDSDLRKASFQERYGEGQVELDALQALYPGTLADVVRQAVQPYRDEDLDRRMYLAGREAEVLVEEIWEDATAEIRDELRAIRGEAESIVERYQYRLQTLADELDADFAPLHERLRDARQAVQDAVDGLGVDLPDRPVAEIEQPDESGWLFDTSRDYLEQLAVYKAHHGAAGEMVA